MSTRQFIACVFRPGDQRSYTFHNDGEPLAIGDKVNVDSSGKMAAVEVVKIVPQPSFPTKPIIGKVPVDAAH